MRLSTRYNQLMVRRRWAVNTIARMVRGWIIRKRIKTTVEALYDTGKRTLKKMKDDWMNARRNRASIRIQMAFRKMRVRVRVSKRLMLRKEMERIRKEMEAAIEENRVNKTVFRQELQDWYHHYRHRHHHHHHCHYHHHHHHEYHDYPHHHHHMIIIIITIGIKHVKSSMILRL